MVVQRLFHPSGVGDELSNLWLDAKTPVRRNGKIATRTFSNSPCFPGHGSESRLGSLIGSLHRETQQQKLRQSVFVYHESTNPKNH
jgi:hypothetical protein